MFYILWKTRDLEYYYSKFPTIAEASSGVHHIKRIMTGKLHYITQPMDIHGYSRKLIEINARQREPIEFVIERV